MPDDFDAPLPKKLLALWSVVEPHKLNSRATAALAEPLAFISELVDELKSEPLAISHRHAVEAEGLARHHDDPFETMLIAQARVEGLVLLSAGKTMKNYESSRFFAADEELGWETGDESSQYEGDDCWHALARYNGSVENKQFTDHRINAAFLLSLIAAKFVARCSKTAPPRIG